MSTGPNEMSQQVGWDDSLQIEHGYGLVVVIMGGGLQAFASLGRGYSTPFAAVPGLVSVTWTRVVSFAATLGPMTPVVAGRWPLPQQVLS